MSDYQDYDETEDVADYGEDDELYPAEIAQRRSDIGNENGAENEDENPEDMEKRVLAMEEELDKLTKQQDQVEKELSTTTDSIDEKSIYVGQVDYDATPEELRAHFAPCGTINRITIMCDKFTGQAKGFAYIEFVEKDSVENALKLDDSSFKGRQLKVLPKRQNVPFQRGGRGGGRGARGAAGPAFAGRGYRGGGRAPFSGRGSGYGGRAPRGGGYAGGRFSGGGRGRGRGGYRGGGRGYYNQPY